MQWHRVMMDRLERRAIKKLSLLPFFASLRLCVVVIVLEVNSFMILA